MQRGKLQRNCFYDYSVQRKDAIKEKENEQAIRDVVKHWNIAGPCFRLTARVSEDYTLSARVLPVPMYLNADMCFNHGSAELGGVLPS